MDNEEFDDTESEPESTTEPDVPEEEEPSELSEVEYRLEVATYYRILLGCSLFDDTNTITDQINDEIQSFVRGRLEKLLNLTPTTPEDHFTPQEIATLKKIAAGGVVTPAPAVATKPAPAAPKAPTPRRTFTAPSGPAKPKVATFAKRGPKPLSKFSNKPSEPDANGAFKENGSWYKYLSNDEGNKVKVKLDKQVCDPTTMVPMPGIDQMPAITAARAAVAIEQYAKDPLRSR